MAPFVRSIFTIAFPVSRGAYIYLPSAVMALRYRSDVPAVVGAEVDRDGADQSSVQSDAFEGGRRAAMCADDGD